VLLGYLPNCTHTTYTSSAAIVLGRGNDPDVKPGLILVLSVRRFIGAHASYIRTAPEWTRLLSPHHRDPPRPGLRGCAPPGDGVRCSPNVSWIPRRWFGSSTRCYHWVSRLHPSGGQAAAVKLTHEALSLKQWPALAVLVILLLAACGPSVTPSGQACATTLCCQGCTTISVTRVIDGDTFESSGGRVRLFGADTPERGERCFSEATQRLRDLAGKIVRVETGPRTQDRYGRLLYYAYTESGESVEETLIREGLARAWTKDGQHRDLLVRVEESTRRNRIGCLWR
jgi:endonuclease YncB( thermonuclease family)